MEEGRRAPGKNRLSLFYQKPIAKTIIGSARSHGSEATKYLVPRIEKVFVAKEEGERSGSRHWCSWGKNWWLLGQIQTSKKPSGKVSQEEKGCHK